MENAILGSGIIANDKDRELFLLIIKYSQKDYGSQMNFFKEESKQNTTRETGKMEGSTGKECISLWREAVTRDNGVTMKSMVMEFIYTRTVIPMKDPS